MTPGGPEDRQYAAAQRRRYMESREGKRTETQLGKEATRPENSKQGLSWRLRCYLTWTEDDANAQDRKGPAS